MTPLRNGLYYGLGLAALAGTSLRHRIGGYRNPTDFSSDDWPQAVAHAHAIVEDWRRHLARRPWRARNPAGPDILELGPGATLGTGVLLTGLGARSYRAVDLFALAEGTPAGFYRLLAETELAPDYDRARVREAVEALERGRSGPVAYATDPDFDIVRAAGGRRFDLVVSNAAFEHFDDVEGVLAQVTEVTRPGAAFLAAVDFQTHTRGIRGSDPNSIYRFSPGLYRRLAFPGQPNRLRPGDYLESLARLGWTNVECRAVDLADPGYRMWSTVGLDPAYRTRGAAMDVLTGVVLATRP